MISNTSNSLEIVNYHDRDQYIQFEDSSHTYTITHPETKIKDSSYTSVTTWVHSLFAPFDADEIIKKMMSSTKWPKSIYYGKSPDEIKNIWDKNRDEAAQAGTKMHYDIECFYNGNIQPNQNIEYKYFLNFERDRSKNLIPFRTEWTVFHEDIHIAGSIDMVFEDKDTGNLHIYDWKRCREIKEYNPYQVSIHPELFHIPDTNFWHYCLQLNIYRMILQEKYDRIVDELWLVCLHPNNKNKSYLKYRVPIMNENMDTLFRERFCQFSLTNHL